MSDGYFVGPIPTRWFFRHFMQATENSMPTPRADFFSVREARDLETMRMRLTTAIYRHGLSPGLEYVVTRKEEHSEPQAGPSSKPIEASDPNRAIPSIYARPKREHSPTPQSTPDLEPQQLDLSHACLPIEVRADDSSDPFLDPLDYTNELRVTVGPYKFAWYGDTREATRSALAAQARELLLRQQRVFVFQLVLCARHARFIRWDRNGAVVTERFDYTEKPSVLADFLWTFAQLSDVQRGEDHTAVLASAREERLFRAAVQRFLRAQSGKKGKMRARKVPHAELTLDDSFPTWKIHVEDQHSQDSTFLIIKRPFHSIGNVTGRATRAYIAYDMKVGRVVFFKDTWRAAYTRRLGAEADTYHTLREHGVPYLPTVLYACDVVDWTGEPQQTKTHSVTLLNRSWDQRAQKSGESVHHRIVQEIAYPLTEAVDEREFVQALRDVVIAIGVAHSKAGIVHRDLSLNNVMLTAGGRGVLNDWDMAGRDDSIIYVGTWTYMSIGVLQNPLKRHDVLDDYESLYWILLYGIMTRYLTEGSEQHMGMFNEMKRDEANKHWVGGKKKLEWILHSEGREIVSTCEPLRRLAADMDSSWRRFYELHANHEGREDEWEQLQARYKEGEFWEQIFERALGEFPVKARMDRKRKAEALEVLESPRRSTRLKASRGDI